MVPAHIVKSRPEGNGGTAKFTFHQIIWASVGSSSFCLEICQYFELVKMGLHNILPSYYHNISDAMSVSQEAAIYHTFMVNGLKQNN